MTFTLEYSPWFVPIALSALIWVTALVWPTDYNPSSLVIRAFLHGFLAIIATLSVWLAYFIYLWVYA